MLRQHSAAGAVHVFISTSPFRKHDRQHSGGATLPLARATADSRLLIAAAIRTLKGIYRPGFNYVKAGVMLVDLQADLIEQGALDLFADAEELQGCTSPRDNSRLMDAMDALNQRFGRGAVTVASAVRPSGPSGYSSKQQRRSPRYTTRLDEIPVARA